MNRTLLLPTLLLVLSVTVLSAQPYSAWAFMGNGQPTQPISIGAVDTTGRMSTIMLQSALPSTAFVTSGCMDADNRSYVVGLGDSARNAGFILVDASGIIQRTITVAPRLTLVAGVVLDTDGNYIVLESNGATTLNTALYRVDRSGKVVATLWSPTGFYPASGVTLDSDTGDFMVMRKGFNSGSFIRVKRDGSSAATVGTTPVNIMNQISFDNRTGNFIIGAWPNQQPPAVLLTMNSGGTVSTLLATGLHSGQCVHPERASAVTHRYLVGSDPGTSGIFAVDAATRAISTIFSSTAYVYQQVFPDRGRNASVLKRSANQWDINLDFPGDGGNNFLVALTLAGTRPGVLLPDGRRIPINVDGATLLSVNGMLKPFLTGNAGMLDPFGRALAGLDFTTLPLPGIQVWVQALTFDATAPLGLGRISDPVLVVL